MESTGNSTKERSRPPRKVARPEDWLVGGGEMGKLVRSMDWSRTPLGPISAWPQSLRTAVSLCLGSNFPISLAWGPQYVQIYNDGYWPICGGKHPGSMGQDFTRCWVSAWPAVGGPFERALTGETSFLEDQRMFLDRNGYLEETFFTFSFSPIRDESGGIGGLFHPVTETTSKMLSARRSRTLRDLAAHASKATSLQDAFIGAAQTLSENPFDVPFALFYEVDASGESAHLLASTGLPAEAAAGPLSLAREVFHKDSPLWSDLLAGHTQLVEGLPERFGPLLRGPYDEPPRRALLLPLTPAGAARPIAIFVAGISARLPLNEVYRAFFDLVATAVTVAVAHMRASEEQRQRVEALAKLDQAKSVFFSNVSHEFRTPLTLMLGPLEDALAATSDELPEHLRELVKLAHRNGLRLLKLVNTLLVFSRIEAGRFEASYEPTDLARFTIDLASLFRAAIERAGLSLIVDCGPLSELVCVDREMWEKIVLNLLSNALKFTFKGEIAVSLKQHGGAVVLQVRDTGTGISAEELPRVFERFHRVQGARSRSYEGSGIGLALVQELVRMHGGEVAADSVVEQGTTFTVTLPLGTAHLPKERIGAKRTQHATTPGAAPFIEEAQRWLSDEDASEVPGTVGEVQVSPSQRGARILVVDDNADLRTYVTALLKPNFKIEAACDGEQALQAVRRRRPDLIISDVMMPVLDGFGLLRELRADPQTRAIPVILLSARAGEEAQVDGLEGGADDYLVKPFAARELLARVRVQLDRNEMRVLLHRSERLASIGLLSAGIAHEINNPLAFISNNLAVLQRDVGSVMQILALWESVRERLASIEPEVAGKLQELADECDLPFIQENLDSLIKRARVGVERVARIVNSLRSLAHVEPTAMEEVHLPDVIEMSLDMAAGQLDRARIKVEVACEKAPKLPGIAAQIGQVLLNLLVNARQAIESKGKGDGLIRISVTCQDQSVVLAVTDNGCGISEADKKRLFDPFFTTKPIGVGTGLGLAISHGIINAHGGRIEVDSQVGEGSCFRIILPCKPKKGNS